MREMKAQTTGSGLASSRAGSGILFQVSTLGAVLEGLYDGEVTFAELGKYGDFGLGSNDALDGVMVALDGVFYRIAPDGNALPADPAVKAAFATVTFFKGDEKAVIRRPLNLAHLQAHLDVLLPSKNIFYAIRIDGSFPRMKTRSERKQAKPYKKFIEVVQTQPTLEFTDVRGTVVGVRCPSYVRGINYPGYHLHFIREDRTCGGHVLDCRLNEGAVSWDIIREFRLRLPGSDQFLRADLEKPDQDLEKVRRDPRQRRPES